MLFGYVLRKEERPGPWTVKLLEYVREEIAAIVKREEKEQEEEQNGIQA